MKFTKPTFASITADFTKKVKQLEELAQSALSDAEQAAIEVDDAIARREAAITEAKRADALKAKIINLLG